MSVHDNLNRVFDVAPVETVTDVVESVDKVKSGVLVAHKESDISKARETLVSLLDDSRDLLGDALKLAKETESPRAIEVATTLIKTIADVSLDVIKIHEDGKNTTKDAKPDVTNATQNNIYVGTTSDLANMLSDVMGK